MAKINQAEIQAEGEKIVLPKGMTFDAAIQHLERQQRYEEEVIRVSSRIACFVWDGAIALQKAMKQIYGWPTAEPTRDFFGENPPRMISVEVGPEKSAMVPWGEFSLPGIKGRVATSYTDLDGKMVFCLTGTIKRKDEGKFKELVELTKKFAKEESIYRSKAVKVRFTNESGEPLEMPEPKFIDLSKVREDEILFSDEVDSAIRTSLFTPIEKSDVCREHGVPLKRGVLLAGPYGTGKTLAAYVTAAKCEKNGWTFLYCERADELEKMVKFAHQYQPAVVFCEDVDRVASGKRTVAMDDILNIVDGIESKKAEIMVILTTNHVENINPAMLRPGRLDAVISVLPPDAETVERLIRMYGRGLVPENANLQHVGKELAGKIPAVVRECVERAKLAAIKLNGGTAFSISSDALLEAARGMRTQLQLLEGKREPSDKEKIGSAIGKWFAEEAEPFLVSANGHKGA
jgi:transitional endoplasmic reticulum ATPase